VDITVYLPDEIGQRAKAEELKLSRMLREAVERELDRRDHMTRLLEDGEPQVYEVHIHSTEGRAQDGLMISGRITGRRIAGDGERVSVYLTTDRRVLVHDESTASYERIDDPPAELVPKLTAWLADELRMDGDPTNAETLYEACEALGVQPVIDL
jgi:post-segregation antitoxin (ccd killing protein)